MPQLTSLQFVDAELARMQAQAAVLQTARAAYAKALQAALAASGTTPYKQARVEHSTVVWNDEIDMAPENLYLQIS
jgi:Arc/MetJ family transcription regulator